MQVAFGLIPTPRTNFQKIEEDRGQKKEGRRGDCFPHSLPATEYLQWGIVTLDPNPSPEAFLVQ
jgi:hypothetical protein